MQKFALRISVFLVSLIVIYVAAALLLVRIHKESGSDYMSAIIDKHRLVDSIKTPKVIFAGGSNIAFGINSEEISRGLQVPVVNLGLHAGLGLSFMLNELQSTVREGDMVFLSTEYFLGSEGNYKLKRHTSEFYPQAQEYYQRSFIEELNLHLKSTRDRCTGFLFSHGQAQEAPSPAAQGGNVYSRAAFNHYGDITAPLNTTPLNGLRDKKVLQYRDWEGIGELNRFAAFAEAHNVRVFYLYPNYPREEYIKNKEAINKLERDLSHNLKIGIVGSTADFIFENADFYDTVYHLNRLGREKRTKKIIELIKTHSVVRAGIAVMKTKMAAS
ncbi:hypothetical protein V9K67_05700 [Paraflavisolibacter sp. H34]|uniref:hypothetical protein n=1 Tax=Huijunlia imazamoxiresistens TaxID=3127457 RepID=UPI00301663B6